MTEPNPVRLAELLYIEAFNRRRDRRSYAYKDGVLDCLKARSLGLRLAPRYKLGTAKADAWFAGVDEGRAIWAKHLAALGDEARHPRGRA